MDKNMLKYREKHKKCKWCKYYKINFYQDYYCTLVYGECILKDKIINYKSLPRLCKYYKVKEKNNEK